MARIIRADHKSPPPHFNLDDVATQASQCIERARAEAADIVAAAEREAAALRAAAHNDGRRAAEQELDHLVDERAAQRAAALEPAVRSCLAELARARHDWIAAWERRAVSLAAAIAQRLVRAELRNRPEIPVLLVNEALQLAAGATRVRLLMNPADVERVGTEIKQLLDQYLPAADTQLVADAAIGAGGCRVETDQGTIDQQFTAQLQRIVEELT